MTRNQTLIVEFFIRVLLGFGASLLVWLAFQLIPDEERTMLTDFGLAVLAFCAAAITQKVDVRLWLSK